MIGSKFRKTPAREAETLFSPQFQARYALAVARIPCPAAAPHTAGEK